MELKIITSSLFDLKAMCIGVLPLEHFSLILAPADSQLLHCSTFPFLASLKSQVSPFLSLAIAFCCILERITGLRDIETALSVAFSVEKSFKFGVLFFGRGRQREISSQIVNLGKKMPLPSMSGRGF